MAYEFSTQNTIDLRDCMKYDPAIKHILSDLSRDIATPIFGETPDLKPISESLPAGTTSYQMFLVLMFSVVASGTLTYVEIAGVTISSLSPLRLRVKSRTQRRKDWKPQKYWSW